MGQGLDQVKYLVFPTEPATDMEYLVDGKPTYFNLDVGSLWFDSTNGVLNMCTAVDPSVVFTPVGYSAGGAHGETFTYGSFTEVVVMAAAATSSSVAEIPAGAVVESVVGRVTTVIPTAADFDIGYTGAANAFGNDVLVAATTEFGGAIVPIAFPSALPVLFTPDAQPGAATGRVRITVIYRLATPPTS